MSHNYIAVVTDFKATTEPNLTFPNPNPNPYPYPTPNPNVIDQLLNPNVIDQLLLSWLGAC